VRKLEGGRQKSGVRLGRGIAPELDQTRLLWMQLPSELPPAFP
jgi:hypothetical protein